MHIPFLRRGLCAVVGGLLAAPVLAQPVAVSEVVITGNPLGREQGLGPVSTMGRQALQERATGSIGETLNGLPGVGSSYFGPNASRPVIRGLDGNRVRILSNGGATTDASALSPDHAVPIEVLAVDRIEVLRGPAALLYGGSAIGGVVNVIDNRMPRQRVQGVQGQARLQAATGDAERSAAALLETGQGDWALHLDAFDRRNGDVRVPRLLDCARPGALSPAHRLCNSSATAQGGAIGLSHFGARHRLGLSVNTDRREYGTVAEDEVRIGMQADRLNLEGEWRQPWPGVATLKARLDSSDYRHTEHEAGEPHTRFSQKGQALRVEARHERWGPWEGVWGLQLESGRFAADAVDVGHGHGSEVFAPHSRTRSQAVFAHEEWRTGWGLWHLGGRLEQVQVRSLGSPQDPGHFTEGERRFNPKSFSWGAQYRLPAGWQLQGHWSYNERAPRDHELFAYGPHLATGSYGIGDAALGLERSRGLDLGLNWASGAHRWSATVFQNRFSNFIALMDTGRQVDAEGHPTLGPDALTEQQYRGVRARLHGLELQGNWRLIERPSTLDVQWRVDQVQARNLDSGQPMPRTPPLRVGATLVHGQGAWSARLGFEHAAAQSRVPAGSVSTAAYTLWHAGWHYQQRQPVGMLHWSLALMNLSDALAYNAASVLTTTAPGRAPLPGRSLRLGVRWQF